MRTGTRCTILIQLPDAFCGGSSAKALPEPAIAITRAHLATALDKKRQGRITEQDLVNWATLLLLNDAYVLDPGDEDLIAEWLNDISLNLDAG